MNTPEPVRAAMELLPQLPIDDEGPVFAAPWQAEAFAMTLALYEKGCFTWSEWAAILGEVIKNHEQQGQKLDYYEYWMLALEQMVRQKSILSLSEMAERQDLWRQAAFATPHGQPINIEKAG